HGPRSNGCSSATPRLAQLTDARRPAVMSVRSRVSLRPSGNRLCLSPRRTIRARFRLPAALAAAGRAAAVEALVAAAVADHDRAAFGARGRVLLDLEGDVLRAQAQGDRRGLAVAVRRVAVVAVGD